ncbi:amidohydrolase family protein [Streptomyces scabiei]|uniref:amidohydrolase family protein n=1 Tax=Streptomyces scabiei TaxID=1930 RepID=UPI0029AFE51F|nr:amidohydrolase family protein [Streptomyces scabiei]MDX3112252.1 amidohydrolase family protein [Streptomyces scabiei]
MSDAGVGARRGMVRRGFLTGAVAVTGAALTSTATARTATPADATRAAGKRSGGGADSGPLAFTHVTVIDGSGAPPASGMTVVVEGGRITQLAPSARIRLRPGTRTVDLTGKYLMPGLIEAHTHSDGPETVVPPLYALAGVTTVREMRGEPIHHEWREKIRSGALLGPRWVVGSPIVDGAPSLWAADVGPTVEVRDAAEARRAVRQVKREGADFVKVYSRLSREAYFAIADEARRQGIPHLGHCPDTVRIAEASASGHRTIEHLHALLLATSRHEKEIRRRLDAVRIDPGDPSSLSRYHSWFQQVHPLEWRAVQGYDRDRADALFRSLAAHGTAVVPTLSVHRTLERPDDVPSRAEEWKYLPAWQVESWPDQLAALTGGRTPEQERRIRGIFAHRLRLVSELHGAGVRLAAGTDTGTGYLVPGFALHDELALLVSAGLTPAEALRAATRDAARTLGLPAVGTVARGQAADLLVLDADPLRDIRNTRRIHGVVVDGRWIPPEERRRLLSAVEEAAAQTPPPQEGATLRGCGCGGHP